MLREAEAVDIPAVAEDFHWQPSPLEDVLTRALSKEDAYAPGR